jgi:hypothetical protein
MATVVGSEAAIIRWEVPTVAVALRVHGSLNDNSPRSDRANGRVLPVVVLGSAEFDVRDIDVSSLRLEGAAPLRHSYHDMAAPTGSEDDRGREPSCPDGYTDLSLKFSRLDVVSALGPVSGDRVALTLTGRLEDGTLIKGMIDVRIVPRKGDSGPQPASPGETSVTALGRAMPNPFNPTTTISYELAKSGHATLEVYDVSGRLVTTLVDGKMTPGRHKVTWEAANVASGIYFYRLTAGSFQQTRKLVLLK